ncbi:MAG: hypothetical protein VW600_15625, partial [Ferrovibrio sp.]
VAAKTMAQSVVNSFSTRYARFGCRAATIAPGYVDTPFSNGLRPAGADALMPEEVADIVLRYIHDNAQDSYISVNSNSIRSGSFRPLSRDLSHMTPTLSSATATGTDARTIDPSQPRAKLDKLDEVFRSVLRLQPGFPLEDARVDVTPGWDSLRHIQLILEIERSLGIRILSQEMDGTTSYDELLSLCRHKLGLSQDM